MRILTAYITVAGGDRTEEFSSRFAATWNWHPPGMETDLVVVCNGGGIEASLVPLKPTYYPRPNVGADIGGFMDVAKSAGAADAMLCFGESIFFHRQGWLKRIADVWERRGPGLYGFFSSNLVNPHLNTTAFVCPPKILASYPEVVVTREQRYEFEHGQRPFWKRVQGLGFPVRLITWDGDYPPGEWRAPHNILWKGNQSNCLFFCKHTDRFFNASEAIKRTWEKNADIGL